MFSRVCKTSGGWGRGFITAVLMCAVLFAGRAASSQDSIDPSAKLPDMRTVIPEQIQVVNPITADGKREILRFSNGVANLGDGPWRMRPEFPLGDITQPQGAVQELLDSRDSSGRVVTEKIVSKFEWHVTHNHWHINGIALFEFRRSNGTGRIGSSDIGGVHVNDVGKAQSLKTTFCLIDWIRLSGNSNNGAKTDRFYFDCAGANQGISVGWVDQYHQATDGQELDFTGAPAGLYYLVSTANFDKVFLEKDTTNNSAWVALVLSRDSKGNAKLSLMGDSFTIEGVGVPPEYTTNR